MDYRIKVLIYTILVLSIAQALFHLPTIGAIFTFVGGMLTAISVLKTAQ